MSSDLSRDEWMETNFRSYASALNLADSLVDLCLRTLRASIAGGDGALWTDSLLHVVLSSRTGRLSSLMSAFEGSRGSMLANFSFSSTLATQDLIITPAFQTPIDRALHWHRVAFPGRKVDADRLFAIEFREALDDYGGAQISTMTYLHALLGPLDEVRPTAALMHPGRHIIDRFVTKCVSAFTLGLLCNVHPLDVFESSTKLIRCQHLSPRKRALRFFLRLRDAVPMAFSVIPDRILDVMALRWDDEQFKAARDLDAARVPGMLSEKSPDYTDRYKWACLYAAQQLARHGVPLGAVAEHLELTNSDSDELWPDTDRLLLMLRNGRIEVVVSDMFGIQRVSAQRGVSDADAARVALGLATPSLIWTDAVVDRFEYLINKPDVSEGELQHFFEMYPEFILSDLHVSAIPQVTLIESRTKRLRPDFALARADSTFVDLIELKRPVSDPLVFGSPRRPTLSRALADAIAQLRDYRDWFRDSANRAWFRQKYEMDGFEPVLTLVVGRRTSFPNEEIKARALEGTGVQVFSYDDLLTIARNRRRLALGA